MRTFLIDAAMTGFGFALVAIYNVSRDQTDLGD